MWRRYPPIVTTLAYRGPRRCYIRFFSEVKSNSGLDLAAHSAKVDGVAARGETYSRNSSIQESIRGPMKEIYRRLMIGQFGEFRSGYEDPVQLEALYKTFETSIQKQLTKNTQIPEIKVVDYINPRIEKLPAIIEGLNSDKYPENLAKFYNIATKQEFLINVLSKLLYKEHLEELIHTTELQKSTVDLSNPAEWFPEARKMKRKFIMHVGPTNSGKTYNSLKELADAKSGYYAGPLRLLAREIYERFLLDGIKCNLITGEEVVPCIDEFGKVSDISSGTIEMIPLYKKMDICVIDEIQMIADERRGAAWTSAVLGVQAKVVHMCGEESAVPLIKKLAKATGDEVEIRTYERLGKLTVLDKPVKNFRNLQKGDCLIAFSKRKILELKCEIERSTKFKVGVIYGALPPEIRSKEANGFNNGQYDILVASDAVGMGLNLKIKRIVFFTVKKFNGSETVPLSVSATKQIAGRAGRFSKDVGELEGFVTTFMPRDLKFLKQTMNFPNKSLQKACIWPTNKIWTYYITKFPKHTSFHDILHQFELETTNVNMQDYFITELDVRFEILNLFLENDLYKKTTLEDQLTLSLAPINIKMASPLVIQTAFNFFQNITFCQTKNVFDFKFLHGDILKSRPKATSTVEQTVEILQALEEDHKLVLMFLWLSQRWPTLFVDKESATDIKSLIEKRISEELLNLRKLIKNTRKR